MSTRCNIKFVFEGDEFDNGMTEFWLYHHCDGYPEGVGADLKHLIKEKNRKMDEECERAFSGANGLAGTRIKYGPDAGQKWTKSLYKRKMNRLAELLDEIVRKGVPVRNWNSQTGYGDYDDDYRDTEYEITTGRHGDIEYLYTISQGKMGHFKVECEGIR